MILTLLSVPGDIFNRNMGPGDALKYEGMSSTDLKIVTRFAPMVSKLTPGILNKVKTILSRFCPWELLQCAVCSVLSRTKSANIVSISSGSQEMVLERGNSF